MGSMLSAKQITADKVLCATGAASEAACNAHRMCEVPAWQGLPLLFSSDDSSDHALTLQLNSAGRHAQPELEGFNTVLSMCYGATHATVAKLDIQLARYLVKL
jgi:hypothetical protein